jgi:chromosome segregation ATPase
MMQAEFEQALGISTPGECLKLSPEIYNRIEDMYMKSDLEKSDFYLQIEMDRTIYDVTSKLIDEKNEAIEKLNKDLKAAREELESISESFEKAMVSADKAEQTAKMVMNELCELRHKFEDKDRELTRVKKEEVSAKARLYDLLFKEAK